MLAEILIDIPLPAEPRLTLGAVDGAALGLRLEELELFSLVRQLAAFEKAFSADHQAEGSPDSAAARPSSAASTAASTEGKPAPGPR